MKIPGIAEAVKERKHDNKTLATLIKDLDSDDAAVRLYAISALERLTGNRFDYEYYAPDEQRAAAVARWRTWLAEQVKAPANAETPARTAGNQMGG